VATFRDKGGIWAKYDYRDVATPEGFAADPALVHSFYNTRRAALPDVEPNLAHKALAELERGLTERSGRLTLVTQNVDDLHERAGSTNIFHMHGELTKARCEKCDGIARRTDDLTTETDCPNCHLKGGMRPDVVWFGEMPKFLSKIADAISEADLFVSIGTSGAVYPAAGFAAEARAAGLPCIELNLEPSENAQIFTDSRYGKASEIVPRWVRDVLA